LQIALRGPAAKTLARVFMAGKNPQGFGAIKTYLATPRKRALRARFRYSLISRILEVALS
jgi:hypothetical protein